MPRCKNDAKRSYKGDEPSPKGFGLCAHAEKAGAKRVGTDGRAYEVRLDKNGTKAWKLVAGTASSLLTFDGSAFSDGMILDWVLTTSEMKRPGPAVRAPDGDERKPIDAAHRSATFSKKAATIVLQGPGTTVTLPAPVLAGALIGAITKYYATRLTAKDYIALEPDLPNWRYKTMAEFKKNVKTFADCRGDHIFYEGLRRVGGKYEIEWGS